MKIRILLADRLNDRGVTRKWLSEVSGIREGTIGDYCRGWVDRMNLDHLAKICTVLNCQITDILQLVDDDTGVPIVFPIVADPERAISDVVQAIGPWLSSDC